MKQKYEALTAAKAKRDELIKQRERTVEMEEKSSAESGSLRAQLTEAEAAHRACEKQHIRELVSDEKLATSKSLTNGLREKLTEAERVAVLAREAILEMEKEISDAQQLVQRAFAKYCNGVKEDISKALGSDTKIRSELMEACAATVAARPGRDLVWYGFLLEIFPEPSKDEIKSAVNEFKSKHRLA